MMKMTKKPPVTLSFLIGIMLLLQIALNVHWWGKHWELQKQQRKHHHHYPRIDNRYGRGMTATGTTHHPAGDGDGGCDGTTMVALYGHTGCRHSTTEDAGGATTNAIRNSNATANNAATSSNASEQLRQQHWSHGFQQWLRLRLQQRAEEDRSIRFPSAQERIRYYMGDDWYEDDDTDPFHNSSSGHATHRRHHRLVVRYFRDYKSATVNLRVLSLDSSLVQDQDDSAIMEFSVSSDLSRSLSSMPLRNSNTSSGNNTNGLLTALNFSSIRQVAATASNREHRNKQKQTTLLGDITRILADSTLPWMDLQEWKYNPNATPFLLSLLSQVPNHPLHHNILRLPHFRAIRKSTECGTSHDASHSDNQNFERCTLSQHQSMSPAPPTTPILWNMMDLKWLKLQRYDDPSWAEKLDVAAFLGRCPTMGTSDALAARHNYPSIRVAIDTANNPRIDARVLVAPHLYHAAVAARNSPKSGRASAAAVANTTTLFASMHPSLLVYKYPERKFFLRHKMIVVEPCDCEMANWALWSNSTVLMPAPSSSSSTGWVMHDRLQPWVHFVPVLSDMSDLADKVDWVLAHPDMARAIAGHAKRWIYDLYFHPDAASDQEKIFSNMLDLYQSYFELDVQGQAEADAAFSPPPRGMMAQAVSSSKKTGSLSSKVFQAGGRTEEELINISKLPIAATTYETLSPPTIKTAVCYKSLFGSVDLHRFTRWAAYNNLLGFDRIFAWYLPSLKNYDGFDALDSLPYVTLIPNEKGYVREVRPGYERVLGDLDQRVLEEVCLNSTAKDYDWVMFADADEFLWFNETIGLKGFLSKYAATRYDYLSFGKKMYTRKYAIDMPDSGIGLDMFPFTTGRYCFARATLPQKERLRHLAHPICPRHFGRSKVIVSPKKHSRVNIHGTHWPDRAVASVHFHSDFAHFKEWPGIFNAVDAPKLMPMTVLVNPINHTSSQHQPAATEYVTVQSFTVAADSDLGLHHSLNRAHLANPDGTYNVTYDAGLHDWFEFVVGRTGV